MAMHHLLLLLLLACTTPHISLVKGQPPANSKVGIKSSSIIYPITCSQPSTTPACDAFLYAASNNLSASDVATLYSTNQTQIQPISRTAAGTVDFLVRVPCRCQEASGTAEYLYNTQYTVQPEDTPYNLTRITFSGLAWNPGSGRSIIAEENLTISLPCGCSSNGGIVVSYAVEQSDTLYSIARMLASDVDGIETMNANLTANPEFLNPGWVLFVPVGQNQEKKKYLNLNLILGLSLSLAFVVIGGLLLFFGWRRRSRRHIIQVEDPPKKMQKSWSLKKSKDHSSEKKIEDVGQFESERPLVFSLAQVNVATSNFDETRKIGEGGYGKVYHGMLGDQEVAIKKMKSSMSKEFYAELKVLCKVHHINVVELIGYASGDGHLYLVYEYVINGSLSEHLHDPLLKGHQPLSWYARAQIALDAARGIEYIHDLTKARYVHRDIKTSNILLDNGLRAKVADFGLAKLMERSSEDEFIATRLVGTPGYLPPEAVRELQMTSKTDVFAFGVLLAEMITGRRALFRDKNEPHKPKSLASMMIGIFREENPEIALEAVIDGNLKNSYPEQQVYKMAEIAACCLNDDPMNRPEIMEITMDLSQILVASTEWEASLGGNSIVFSGIMNGR